MAEFRKGDSVLLVCGPLDLGTTPGILKHRNEQFKVSRVLRKVSDHKPAGNGGFCYELDGLVSKYGVPYTISGDWLVRVVEADGEK